MLVTIPANFNYGCLTLPVYWCQYRYCQLPVQVLSIHLFSNGIPFCIYVLWYLKRPKYLIKYDLLNLVTPRIMRCCKNLSVEREIELDEIFQMVYGLPK